MSALDEAFDLDGYVEKWKAAHELGTPRDRADANEALAALAAAERRGAEAALREAAAEIDRMMVADRSSIRRQAFGRAATLVAEMGRGARSGRGR
jgi:hypothetical protein